MSNLTEYFEYPCASTTACEPYEFVLHEGIYLVELYGASGGSAKTITNAQRLSKSETIPEFEIQRRGGNALPKVLSSTSGAGAYTKGVLRLKSPTKAFLHIGGRGEYKRSPYSLGGYNGGGRGMTNGAYIGGGGGGSTDLRLEIDDFWHRVMATRRSRDVA